MRKKTGGISPIINEYIYLFKKLYNLLINVKILIYSSYLTCNTELRAMRELRRRSISNGKNGVGGSD